MRLRRTITLSFCLLAVAAPTLAFDLGQLQVNGFLSQGYLQSDGNNVFTVDSTDGSLQFNEFGLTLNADLGEQLHVGAQLLSRDLGDEGNNQVKLDWGYGDYRFADWFGVRAGKIKLPAGFYNEGRDTDVLRPMVFLPQSLYDEMRRDILNAVVGVGIYGFVPAGKAGSLHYQAVYGELDIADDSFFNDYFVNEINRQLVALGGAPVLEELQYDSKYMASASLIYQPPLDGLRLGVTASAGEGHFSSRFNSLVDPATDLGLTDTTVQVNLKNFYVVSAEYATARATLSAECYRMERTITIFGQPYNDKTREGGGYLMASVPLPFAPGLSVNGVYDIYLDDLGKRDDWRYYTKDLGLGVRYDPDQHWTLKAEYHDAVGEGRVYRSFNPEGEVKGWSYWLVKTSYNF